MVGFTGLPGASENRPEQRPALGSTLQEAGKFREERALLTQRRASCPFPNSSRRLTDCAWLGGRLPEHRCLEVAWSVKPKVVRPAENWFSCRLASGYRACGGTMPAGRTTSSIAQCARLARQRRKKHLSCPRKRRGECPLGRYCRTRCCLARGEFASKVEAAPFANLRGMPIFEQRPQGSRLGSSFPPMAGLRIHEGDVALSCRLCGQRTDSGHRSSPIAIQSITSCYLSTAGVRRNVARSYPPPADLPRARTLNQMGVPAKPNAARI
jgi:hypothetical protein